MKCSVKKTYKTKAQARKFRDKCQAKQGDKLYVYKCRGQHKGYHLSRYKNEIVYCEKDQAFLFKTMADAETAIEEIKQRGYTDVEITECTTDDGYHWRANKPT